MYVSSRVLVVPQGASGAARDQTARLSGAPRAGEEAPRTRWALSVEKGVRERERKMDDVDVVSATILSCTYICLILLMLGIILLKRMNQHCYYCYDALLLLVQLLFETARSKGRNDCREIINGVMKLFHQIGRKHLLTGLFSLHHRETAVTFCFCASSGAFSPHFPLDGAVKGAAPSTKVGAVRCNSAVVIHLLVNMLCMRCIFIDM